MTCVGSSEKRNPLRSRSMGERRPPIPGLVPPLYTCSTCRLWKTKDRSHNLGKKIKTSHWHNKTQKLPFPSFSLKKSNVAFMFLGQKLEKGLDLARCSDDSCQRKSTRPRAFHCDETLMLIYIINLIIFRSLLSGVKWILHALSLGSVRHDWHGVFIGVIYKVTIKKHKEIHLSKI